MNPLRASLAVTGSAVASAALSLAVGILAARTLGPAGQGMYAFTGSAATIVVLLTTFGTGTALRILSRTAPSADLTATFVQWSALAIVLSATCVPTIVHLVTPEQAVSILWAAAAYAAAMALGRQYADYIQSLGLALSSRNSLTVGTAVQLAGFAGSSVLGMASVTSLLLAGAAGSCAQAVYASSASHRVTRKRSNGTTSGSERVVRISTNEVRSLATVGAKALPNLVAITVLQRADRLLLAALAGPRAAGIYTVAATVAESIRLIPMAIGQLAFVEAAEHRKITQRAEDLRRIAFTGLTSVGAVAFISGPFFIPWIFGDAYKGSAELLMILIVAELFMGMAILDSRILMGIGQVGRVARASLGAIPLGIVVYVLFILGWEATGAAAATVIVYAGYSMCMAYFVRISRADAIDV